uniref:PNPLA domain-containing protein n=1 Tax=viral metagenome TaxID=1070528 RepID=A0A6C0JK92_9ZZZZ
MDNTINIKHLVISGGGPSLFQYLSIIQYLDENKIIDLQKIESIYGTSAGSIVGILLCLNYDWETLNNYAIMRPWHELFHIKISNIFEAYKNRGIFNKGLVEKAFKPLLDAKDLSIHITLKEFYEYSKIELHFYSFEVNQFNTEDISYLTHPELSLIDAVMMSSAIPILVTPVIIDNKCYMDGGVAANYPLKYCIDSGKNEDEILGLRNKYDNQQKNYVDSDSNLLDLILCFFFKMFNTLGSNNINPKIKYEITCNVKNMSLNYLASSASSIEVRKELYQKGVESAKDFILLFPPSPPLEKVEPKTTNF